MTFRISALIILLNLGLFANAQLEQTYEHVGEYGVSFGLGHYFGDLNPNAAINHPKFAAGIFYLKQLNNYISIKAAGNYTFLGYSDAYSKDANQRIRNLSFNTDVWEVSVSGNFNFFKFYPQIPEYRFTPYLSVGIGAINFNPYTYLNGNPNKYYLRTFKTEGQDVAYNPYALVVPIGFGLKYNLTDNVNIFGELLYRFTSTGYLDDVYGTYAGSDAFKTSTEATQLLQDRSYIYGVSHKAGVQRGNGKTDSYATLQIGVSINLDANGYRCPTY
jgi:hypothetical protein